MRSKAKTEEQIYRHYLESVNDPDTDEQEIPDPAFRPESSDDRKASEERRQERPGHGTEKVRKRKKRRKKHYFLRFFVVAAIIAACAAYLSTPKFDIEKIRVDGNSQIKDKVVIEESGIKKGNNIFRINTFSVKRKMLENPYYEDISIKRELPSTLVIEVTERKPAVAFPYGEKYVLISSDGIVMKLSKTNPSLPEIVGVTITEMEKGEVLVTSDSQLFEKSLAFLTLAESEDLFFRRIDLRFDKARLNVYKNLYVKGSYEDVKKNIENGNLKKVLVDLYNRDIERGTVLVDGTEYCSYTPTFN